MSYFRRRIEDDVGDVGEARELALGMGFVLVAVVALNTTMKTLSMLVRIAVEIAVAGLVVDLVEVVEVVKVVVDVQTQSRVA